MNDVAHQARPGSDRLPISATGTVRALEAGLLGTVGAGAVALFAAANAAPILLVAGLPVAAAALSAALGYRLGSKEKP